MPNQPLQTNLSGLRTGIRNALRNGERIAILGIGSDLRGDDEAGLLAGRLVQAACRRLKNRSVRVFIGGVAPENISGLIVRFAPSLVVMLDAADMGLRPGTVCLVPPGKAGGFSFSTHAMPLAVLAEYLEWSAGCSVMLVGIQPARTDLGFAVTPAVKAAAERVAAAICSAVTVPQQHKRRRKS